MSDPFSVKFTAEDKVSGGSIPMGTILVITAEPHDTSRPLNPENRETLFGEPPYVRAGISPNAKKIFYGLRFRVAEADNEDYIGRPVDSTLWVDKGDAKFRAQAQMITGIELPRPDDENAPEVDFGPMDVAEALANHSFRVKVGPKNKDGSGYTEVKYYNEKLDRIELPQTEISEFGGASAAGGDSSFNDWEDDENDGF